MDHALVAPISRREPAAIFELALIELEKECGAGAVAEDPRRLILRARQDYENYGFCFSLGDWNPDVFAVGVAMVSADRSRVLAFNVSGRVNVMTRDKLIHDFGPKLVALRNSVFERTEGRF